MTDRTDKILLTDAVNTIVNQNLAGMRFGSFHLVAPLNDSADEIVIETEKIERIIVEEEFVEGKKQKVKGKSSLPRTFAFYLLPFSLFVLLGGYAWQNIQKPNNNI